MLHLLKSVCQIMTTCGCYKSLVNILEFPEFGKHFSEKQHWRKLYIRALHSHRCEGADSDVCSERCGCVRVAEAVVLGDQYRLFVAIFRIYLDCFRLFLLKFIPGRLLLVGLQSNDLIPMHIPFHLDRRKAFSMVKLVKMVFPRFRCDS